MQHNFTERSIEEVKDTVYNENSKSKLNEHSVYSNKP